MEAGRLAVADRTVKHLPRSAVLLPAGAGRWSSELTGAAPQSWIDQLFATKARRRRGAQPRVRVTLAGHGLPVLRQRHAAEAGGGNQPSPTGFHATTADAAVPASASRPKLRTASRNR